MEFKISVIIPVYNVEKYLPDCLNSIVNQTYRNLEIILVNDGSTDNSPKICDEYAEKDSRIKVIHKSNGGLSSARNVGIKAVSGDYVLFIDSDDFYESLDAIKIMVERVKVSRADLLNFSYQKYYENSGEKEPYFNGARAMPLENADKEKQLEYIFCNSLFIASACNKLISKDLLIKNSFVEGVYSEDIDWCARLLNDALSIDFIPDNFYCYRQRGGSISHSISFKSCLDLSNNILKCINICENAEENIKNYLNQYTGYQLSTFIAIQAYVNPAPKKLIKTLSMHKKYLSYYGASGKVKKLHILCLFLGFRTVCKIVRLTKRLWAQ